MEDQTPMSGMSQGKTFLLGITAGVLVLCTIGFFILLSMQFGDKDTKVAVNTGGTPTQVANAGNVAPTAITLEPVADDEHIKGAKKAKITLVEYSDFQCPYCGAFEPTIDQVLEKYPDDVRVVYRHFPLRSIHPNAAPAANASECAAEQGKFWEFHAKLFVNQEGLSTAFYSSIAKEIGLNVSKFDSCVSSNKFAADVQADEASAQAAGGRGTPYSILVGPNGEQSVISGAQPFSAVDAAIQQML